MDRTVPILLAIAAVVFLALFAFACGGLVCGALALVWSSPPEMAPTKVIVVTRVVRPTETPVPTARPAPTATREAVVTEVVRPTKTPALSGTPKPTRGPTRTPRPTSTHTPVPSGPPAEVVATMPSAIPCSRWSGDGCRWDFTVTFTEKAGVDATIERVGRRYIDRKGTSWFGGGREWGMRTIVIPAHGSNKYSSWVRTTAGGRVDLMGGTVKVSYSGRDANGNPFSGSVTATLSWPVWPTYTPSPTKPATPTR